VISVEMGRSGGNLIGPWSVIALSDKSEVETMARAVLTFPK
jgi:hypothetical protein